MKNSLYSLIGFFIIPFIWDANSRNFSEIQQELPSYSAIALLEDLKLDTGNVYTKQSMPVQKKINGELELKNLEVDFDGTPKAATIETLPAGLRTLALYVKDGTIHQEAPTEKGIYELIVVINDPSSEATTQSVKFVIK